MAGKEIDPIRARSALAVIKQHPGMVLFVASPALVLVGLIWWLGGAGWGSSRWLSSRWSARGPSCGSANGSPKRSLWEKTVPPPV